MGIQKAIGFIFCLPFITVQFFVTANADPVKSEKANTTKTCHSALSIEKSILIARNRITKILKENDFYIDSAILECTNSEAVWVIGIRRISYQSGHLLFYVHENGQVEENVLKDG